MDRNDSLRYDILIYGQSALLAASFGKDVRGLRETLQALGVNDAELLAEVAAAQASSEYELSCDGRGLRYDEGVYECIKDCLRPVYGF